MLIKQKHLRAYIRQYCKRQGSEFNRKHWLVRRHQEGSSYTLYVAENGLILRRKEAY